MCFFSFQGIFISRVNKGGAAEKAGIHVGDRLLEVGRESLSLTGCILCVSFTIPPTQHVEKRWRNWKSHEGAVPYCCQLPAGVPLLTNGGHHQTSRRPSAGTSLIDKSAWAWWTLSELINRLILQTSLYNQSNIYQSMWYSAVVKIHSSIPYLTYSGLKWRKH